MMSEFIPRIKNTVLEWYFSRPGGCVRDFPNKAIGKLDNKNSYNYLDYSTNYPTPEILDIISRKESLAELSYSIQESVRLIGHKCVVLNRQFKPVLKSTLGSLKYLVKTGDAKYIFRAKRLKSEVSLNISLRLVSPLSNSYFHWVTESLPLLWSYFDYKKRNPESKVTVIIDGNAPKFQFQYLSLMGIEQDEIVEWSFTAGSSKFLLWPELNFQVEDRKDKYAFHIYHQAGLDWLRNTLLEKVKNGKTKRLYISRKRARDRRVLNEQSINNYLIELGFQIVELEQLSVQDQVSMFSSVEIVVAPHGAGLTNLIFGRSGHIIEFFPDNSDVDATHVFFQITNMYHTSHQVIRCKSDDNGDMIVNLENLQEAIQNIENQ